MSLKLKVNLFFAMLLLLTMLASASILMMNARQSVKVEVKDTMDATAHIITVALADRSLSREHGIINEMQEMVRALSELRSLHILMFDERGLLFEGAPDESPEEHPPEWFAKLIYPQIQPLSKRFGNGHMVIYAAPMQEISERWRDIRDIIMLGVGIFILMAAFLYWGMGKLLSPLQRLVDALSAFEKGNLQLRLPRFPLREMDQIGQTFNRMGQALEHSVAENRRLAKLVKQSGDAILSLDHAGYITFCNATAERLFAHQTPVLQGETFSSLNFRENRRQIHNTLAQCESVENLETSIEGPAGETTHLLMSAVPLIENESCVVGVICTLRDITELKHAESARQQLRETRLLTTHMDEAQEEERRHLARELHDELGQCLTAIKTDAVLIRNRTEQSEPKLFQSSQAIIDTASHIYDVVHNMITRLRPSPLDDLGLVPTLQESISKWQSRESGIHFSLDVDDDISGLDEKLNMTVFRVVQEAITNAVRHAQAKNIAVRIYRITHNEIPHLSIEISDDGIGMEVKDFHSDVDFGLLGMRERAHSLGGTFELNSRLGEGVSLHVMIPIGASHHEPE